MSVDISKYSCCMHRFFDPVPYYVPDEERAYTYSGGMYCRLADRYAEVWLILRNNSAFKAMCDAYGGICDRSRYDSALSISLFTSDTCEISEKI